METYDAVVIGAGNAGLTAGAALAQGGAKVLVLERHNIPGGSATSFCRGRFEFEVALHQLSGIGTPEKPGPLRMVLDQLGVMQDLTFMPMTDLYHVMIPGKLDILLEPDRARATGQREVPGCVSVDVEQRLARGQDDRQRVDGRTGVQEGRGRPEARAHAVDAREERQHGAGAGREDATRGGADADDQRRTHQDRRDDTWRQRVEAFARVGLGGDERAHHRHTDRPRQDRVSLLGVLLHEFGLVDVALERLTGLLGEADGDGGTECHAEHDRAVDPSRSRDRGDDDQCDRRDRQEDHRRMDDEGMGRKAEEGVDFQGGLQVTRLVGVRVSGSGCRSQGVGVRVCREGRRRAG